MKQKFSFHLTMDFQHGLRAVSNVDGSGVEFKQGPCINPNLVTEETIKKIIACTNQHKPWQFLKLFIRNVDAYIVELESLVAE